MLTVIGRRPLLLWCVVYGFHENKTGVREVGWEESESCQGTAGIFVLRIFCDGEKGRKRHGVKDEFER